MKKKDPTSHRIIEKRRRDRMNNCLADLSKLIPAHYMKKGRGRVEKTEIIEMAIKHLKDLIATTNAQQPTGLAPGDQLASQHDKQQQQQQQQVVVAGAASNGQDQLLRPSTSFGTSDLSRRASSAPLITGCAMGQLDEASQRLATNQQDLQQFHQQNQAQQQQDSCYLNHQFDGVKEEKLRRCSPTSSSNGSSSDSSSSSCSSRSSSCCSRSSNSSSSSSSISSISSNLSTGSVNGCCTCGTAIMRNNGPSWYKKAWLVRTLRDESSVRSKKMMYYAPAST